MKTSDIFESWGTEITTTFDDLMSADAATLRDLLVSRNLLLIKGLNGSMSDHQFFELTSKFGTNWTGEDYRNPLASKGNDPTISGIDTPHPVSHFKSTNNLFMARAMDYHADMPHVGDKSYPARALLMERTTADDSGITSWLNLEHAWSQCTIDQQTEMRKIQFVYHDMYRPGTRMQKRPFLKVNPRTGKMSPDMNCVWDGRPSNLAWINHIIIDGVALSPVESKWVINSMFDWLETKPDCLFNHQWSNGDLIVYDNWFNAHKRSGVNDANRLLRRITFNI